MSSSNKNNNNNNNNNNINKHHSRSRSRERENSDSSYHRHRRDSSPSRHHHRYHDNIKIYISNLSSNISQHKIKDEFNKYGSVYDLVLKKKMEKVQIILALLLCQKKQTLNMQ
jgi:RNA recognition motif-containing protein